MSRTSTDEYRDGLLWNGFDYAAQAWVKDGVYQMCGHPESMRARRPCCPASTIAGRRVGEVGA